MASAKSKSDGFIATCSHSQIIKCSSLIGGPALQVRVKFAREKRWSSGERQGRWCSCGSWRSEVEVDVEPQGGGDAGGSTEVDVLRLRWRRPAWLCSWSSKETTLEPTRRADGPTNTETVREKTKTGSVK